MRKVLIVVCIAALGLALAQTAPRGRIAFVSERDGNQEIYTMRPDGADLQRLTISPGADYDPNWNISGTQLAFVSERTGDPEIFAVNADGSNLRRLSASPARDTNPRWSALQNLVAFESDRTGDVEIFVTTENGTPTANVSRTPGVSTGAAWSPNGLTLAYVQWDTTGENSEIVVVSFEPTGFGFQGLTISERRVLTNDGGRKRDITWFSDGSRLAYLNFSEGVDGLYVVGVAVPIFQNLVQGPFNLSTPSFLTGGMALAYLSDENGVDSVFQLSGRFMGNDTALPLAVFAFGQPIRALTGLDSRTVLIELGPRATSQLGVLDLTTAALTIVGGPGPNFDAHFFREPPSTV